MQQGREIKDCVFAHKRTTAIIFGVTVAVWVLLAWDFVPQYQRTVVTTFLSYFFPVWIIIGYVGYGLLAKISETERKNQTQDDRRFYYSILHDRNRTDEELNGHPHGAKARQESDAGEAADEGEGGH
jgi:amino acid permease